MQPNWIAPHTPAAGAQHLLTASFICHRAENRQVLASFPYLKADIKKKKGKKKESPHS